MDDRTRGRERLAEVTSDLTDRPDVGVSRMFGSEGYSVRGKLFAFVSTDGRLEVKLSGERIEELGLDNMVMRGSPMREWAAVPFDEGAARWRSVAEEAHAFVDSITPRWSSHSAASSGSGAVRRPWHFVSVPMRSASSSTRSRRW